VRKVIISCAVTGSAPTMKKNPAVPVTPREIAKSALGAWRAGAAIVHLHVRNPETGAPSMEQALYAEAFAEIRGESDVIVNLTTGPGARYIPSDADPLIAAPGTTFCSPQQRVTHITALRPDMCSLDVGTMNFGEAAFINTPKHLGVMAEAIVAAGVSPELEVFEPGHIRLARHMIDGNQIVAPFVFQICLGISWGQPCTPEAMLYMRNMLPVGANWFAFGVGAFQFPMAAQAVLLGGNVRVGLEDNLYLEAGRPAASNAELVEKAVGIVRDLGQSVATVAEAREILNLPL
jgi:uncharacterized protein (DUF849 family)